MGLEVTYVLLLGTTKPNSSEKNVVYYTSDRRVIHGVSKHASSGLDPFFYKAFDEIRVNSVKDLHELPGLDKAVALYNIRVEVYDDSVQFERGNRVLEDLRIQSSLSTVTVDEYLLAESSGIKEEVTTNSLESVAFAVSGHKPLTELRFSRSGFIKWADANMISIRPRGLNCYELRKSNF